MGASYFPGHSVRDAVRLRLDDRAAPFVLQDEEIDAVLGSGVSQSEATAQLALTIAASWSKQAMMTRQGTLQRQYADRAQFYRSLAEDCRRNPTEAIAGGAVGEMCHPDLSEFIDL